MKKHLTTLLALCFLLGAFAMPASALEYTFDSPSTGDFGTPTSDDTIYEHQDPNVDRSKGSAHIQLPHHRQHCGHWLYRRDF